jgi:hypothetical protein
MPPNGTEGRERQRPAVRAVGLKERCKSSVKRVKPRLKPARERSASVPANESAIEAADRDEPPGPGQPCGIAPRPRAKTFTGPTPSFAM